MMKQYAGLKRLCEQATPGPWIARMIGGGKGRPNEYSMRQAGPQEAEGKSHIGTVSRNSGNAGKNAAFIAAANPEVVRSLLEKLEAAEKVLDDASSYLTRPDSTANYIGTKSILHRNFNEALATIRGEK